MQTHLMHKYRLSVIEIGVCVGGIHLIKFSDNCLLRGKHEWLSSKGKDSGFQKPDVLS